MAEPGAKRAKRGEPVAAPVPSFSTIEDKLRYLEQNRKLVDVLKRGWPQEDLRGHIVKSAKAYAPPPSWTHDRREQKKMFEYNWTLIREDGCAYHPDIRLSLKSGKVELVRRNGEGEDVDVKALGRGGDFTYRIPSGSSWGGDGDEIYDFQFMRCPIYGKVQLWIMNWVESPYDPGEDEDAEPPGGYRQYVAVPVGGK